MTSPRWIAPSDRYLSAALLLSFVLLIAVLGPPLLVGKVHVGDDLGNMHQPVRSVYQEALRTGQGVLESVPLRRDLRSGGHVPPVHWLLYRFLALDWAFTVELVLSCVFMFPGMYLILRRWSSPARLRSSAP